MRLSVLLHSIYPVEPAFDCEVSGLALSSREVAPDYLFLALPGRCVDGRQYIDQALAQGAKAVLAESYNGSRSLEWRQSVPILFLPQLQTQLTEIAQRFFDFPAKKIKKLAVTGTNGKTSCTHFLASALEVLGHPCGLIGTLGYGLPGALKDIQMTTPDTIHLQKIFADLIRQGAEYAALEVSSHSLDQERVKGLDFELGIFTNLTQDHLDYHGDMQAYGAAKKRLFTDYPLGKAIINADDAFGQSLLSSLPPEKVLVYSIKNTLNTKNSVYVENLNFDLSGLSARVITPWGQGDLSAALIGEFNLSNVLAVLAALGALGFALPEILAALAQLKPVPGRMQIFGGQAYPHVVVDYSHTPDALEKALLALRKHCQGKLLCLFGCGGDRDKGKRPLMGAIAERHADLVMLTNDNPRHEQPEQIIAEILAGLQKPEQARVQVNRSKAIEEIIQYAGPSDYVLVAGKGAENYQQFGDEKVPFSDVERIKEILMV